MTAIDEGGYSGDLDDKSQRRKINQVQHGDRVGHSADDEIMKSDSMIEQLETMKIKTQQSLVILQSCFCGCNSVDEDGNFRYMLSPHSPRRAVWNVVTMFLLIYIAILLPYRLSFEDEATGFMAYFEMFIDLFFIVDIMINFRTGYLETGLSGTKEILDPRKVARAYLRGWFCIDLLSSIPLSVVEVFMPQLDDSLRAIKFLRFYKLTRLLKLSKLIKAGALAEVLDDWLILQRQNLKMAKMLMLSFVVTHTIACAWAGVGLLRTEKDYEECDNDVWYCRYEHLHWDNATHGSRYLAAMYFSMTIISSVGFGDLYPINNAERALAIFCMILGGSFYGFLLATMSSLVSHMDSNSRKYYERMDEVISYMQHRKFPLELAYRVRNYFKNFLREKNALDERRILQELSTRLRMEVCLFLINDVVYSVDLFTGLEPDALACLIIILKPVHCNEGDYIFRKGDAGTEFYIIITGEMIAHVGSTPNTIEGSALTTPSNAMSRAQPKQKVLRAGQYFGELSALDLQSKRTCSVSSATFCDMYSLSREELYSAFHRQLSVMDSMRSIAVANARANYEDQAGYVGKQKIAETPYVTGVTTGTLGDTAPVKSDDESPVTAMERGRQKKEENRAYVRQLRLDSMFKKGTTGGGSHADRKEIRKKKEEAAKKADTLRKERMAVKSKSGLRRMQVESRKTQVLDSMKGKKFKKNTAALSLSNLGGSTRNLFSHSRSSLKSNNTAPMLPPARPAAGDEAKDAEGSSQVEANAAAAEQAAAFAAAPEESDSEDSDAEEKANSAFSKSGSTSRSVSVNNGDPSVDTKSNGDGLEQAKVPSPFAEDLESLVNRSIARKERRGSIHLAQNTHQRSMTSSPHKGVNFTSSGIEITQQNTCISAKHLVVTLTETQNVWLRHVLSELESLRLLLISLQTGDPFDGNRLQSGIQICQTTLNVIHTCIKNIHGFVDSNHLMVGELEEDEQVCCHGEPETRIGAETANLPNKSRAAD